MTGTRRSATALGISLLVGAATAAAGARGGGVRIPGHVLPALPRATRTGRGAAGETLTLTFVLSPDDRAGFERHLRALYDPASPDYRHFLGQQEIADRFGPSRRVYGRLVHWLRRRGLQVVAGSANRLTLTVRGTRAVVERALAVRIDDYRLGDRAFHANADEPILPRALARHVQAIAGLSNAAVARSTNVAAPLITAVCLLQSIPIGATTSQQQLFDKCVTELIDLRAYGSFGIDPPPPSWLGMDGTGQKIGLVEFDAFQTSDVADFLALTALPKASLANLGQVHVNGGAPAGADQSEVLLDIDAVMTVAPGAQVVVYDAPFTGPGIFQAVLNQMLNDGVSIIGNSWAYCEDQTTAADAQSIDAILQHAAMSNVGVFNGAGDTGSTCLDGSASTVAVPADSPHATAVGGSSLAPGPGIVYGTETWWDGAAAVPPTGQGGFGVSRFFPRPSWQDGLDVDAMRSVPDVVADADPVHGIEICQASAGGCPSGLLYGGTSLAAPVWAAFAALLNQAHGTNLGFLNPSVYPLAATDAFHGPAALGTDFAHVGLGSPNLDVLHLMLDGQSAGPADAAASEVTVNVAPTLGAGVPSDGTTEAFVVVILRDANGNIVPGKTVTLAANVGSHATIAPPSGVTSTANGAAVFTLTDAMPETVTVTATDTSDGLPLAQQPDVPFVTPPASAGGVAANPTLVAADGTSATTITVTLRDAHGNGVAGKTVALTQGAGRSQIAGPTPATTDVSGQLTFTATDTFTETVTYGAIDVTDGELPVPATAQVSFTSGAGSACNVGQDIPAAGWAVTSPVTGFALSNNCVGASGTAWDPSGNLWVMNYPTGKLYRLPTAGGAASDGTLVGQVPNATPPTGLPSCPHGLAFSKDGQHLYLARQFCGGGGDVVEISTEDASVVRNVTTADAIHCATGIATDPLSGDLFVTSPCQTGNDLFRIADPESGSPQVSVYASPGRGIGLNFTPDGTLWTEAYPNGTSDHMLVKISGTGSAQPGMVTPLSTDAPPFAGGVLPVFNPTDPASPPFLLVSNGTTGGASGSVSKVDLTQTPPVVMEIATGASGMIFLNGGPDGCAYVSNGDRVDRITAADGTCNFAPSLAGPTLALTPAAVVPNPAQGTPETFTATVANATAPAGTPVFFHVTGANPQIKMVRTGAAGQAAFTYTAARPGDDVIVATTTVGATTLTSNRARVTWGPGKHASFLTLSPSPRAGAPGHAVNVAASLADVSAAPPAVVAGAPIAFSLGAAQCAGTTGAGGVASCALTPGTIGTGTLTASFAGTDQLLAATASVAFEVTCPAGLDGVKCYLDAFRSALDAAAHADVARPVKKRLLGKVKKLDGLVTKAGKSGKRGARALKALKRQLDGLVRTVTKLRAKKLAPTLHDTLVALATAARAAAP